ncbi:MAG TPA: hypothetical protein VFV87_22580, partial [Pirellulaceae bacterium]|nr:hypothetical protein [Pirellulaceae bacterium]
MDLRLAIRAAAWALLACCAGLDLPAAEPATWHEAYPAALAEAQSESKLLLIVDVADDFTRVKADGPQAKLYRSLALADKRVAGLLAAHFVTAFRPVGPPACLQLLSGDDETRPRPASRTASAAPGPPPDAGEYAIAYVCLPGERVLHCIPGFVTADELLKELQWAVEANDERLRAPPTEKLWFLRQRHLAAALPRHVEPFAELYESRWKKDFQAPATQSANDLATAIRVAQTVREHSLAARLKSVLPAGESREQFLKVLSAHGGLEMTLAHLVLSEFPLPPLADLAQPLFETASGDHYWQSTPRRAELAEWWTEHGRAGAQRLIAVSDDPRYIAAVRAPEPFKWPPTSPDVRPHLGHFATLHVSLDE